MRYRAISTPADDSTVTNFQDTFLRTEPTLYLGPNWFPVWQSLSVVTPASSSYGFGVAAVDGGARFGFTS